MKKNLLKLNSLTSFLNTTLNIEKFGDYCPNGLQLESTGSVQKIALGVSVSLRLFEKAKEIGADTVLVHHGLFWNKMPYELTGIHGARVRFLFQNRMNLLAYHLPLDHHPVLGNNAQIANALKLKGRSGFAFHGGMPIGLLGNLPKALSPKEIEKILHRLCGQTQVLYPFGKSLIKTIGIVTGAAPLDAEEAQTQGADLFITGEIKEQTQEWCREAHMNFLSLGHYASEQFGVQALGKAITKKFAVPCEFIDVPNRA